MELTSVAFKNGESIPDKYSGWNENINPPLAWSGAPPGTASFALIMEDPDVPSARLSVFDHWIIFNIPPLVSAIAEGEKGIGVSGTGTSGSLDYAGPRPPDREHRYFFYLYALDAMLDLPEGAAKGELLSAMGKHILEKATLMGRYAPR